MSEKKYTEEDLQRMKKKWAAEDKKRTDEAKKKVVDFNQELSKIPGMNDTIKASFTGLSSAIDKLFDVGKGAYGGLDEFGRYGKNKYDAIQKQFGGIRDINNAATETAKVSAQAFDDIYSNWLGNAENTQGMMINLNGEMVNAATAFYDDVTDISNNYLEVRAKVAGRQSTMFNKMSREDQTKISIMEKGFQISNDKVAQLWERQISTTGEASTKIFTDMAAYADAISKKTGVSFQEISQSIANIMTDVKRFGNVQVDEAARIAGALDQLGMSYEGFGGMIDQFASFDQAATSLGNLTTVFGVHFDAMEMMQLANEDQEEFLYRMRDAFLDSGKAIEDMTLAEKKLAAQQMGMSVQDFENFMQEDREISDLTSITDEVDPSEGFQKMSENMKQVEMSGDKMKQYMINKVMDPMSREAYDLAEDFGALKKAMIMDPEKFLPGYEKFKQGSQSTIKSTVSGGPFDDNYDVELKNLLTLLTKSTELGISNEQELRKQIEALQNQEDVSFKDYAKVIASTHGSQEFFQHGMDMLGERVSETNAITADMLEKEPFKTDIDAKKKLDQEAFDEAQRQEFMYRGMSESERKQAEEAAKSQAEVQAQIQKPAEVETVAIQEQPAEVNVEFAEVDAAQPALNTAQKEVQTAAASVDQNAQAVVANEQVQSKKREARIIDKITENNKQRLQNFKEAMEGITIANNLHLDGKVFLKQLIGLKTSDGSTIALVNASGDIV